MNMNTINQFNFQYASIFRRFLAYFIDLICIAILTYIFYLIVQMFSFFVGILDWSDFISRNWYYFVLVIILLIAYFYFTILPSSSFSSTFGQLIMKIKQVDKYGNPITFLTANVKLFASFLSKILYIGYFLVYFNPYHQTFHEMLTDTYLIQR